MSENGQNGWTRWWWLRVDQAGQWSAIERRAVHRFLLTWTFTVIVTGLPAWPFLHEFLGFSAPTSLILWLTLAWPLNLPTIRGLTSTFFPGAVICGDDLAAERLGGRVDLPTNEFWIRNFWWIDALPIKGSWSDEQMKIRERALVIAALIFVLGLLIIAREMMAHGFNERTSAFVAFLSIAPIALYAARRICMARWPELVNKADDDAVRLANKSVPPRM